MAVHYLPATDTRPECFSISTHQWWLPGFYATEAAARWAIQFPDATLQEMSDRICTISGENRPITTEDLRRARAELASA